MGKSLDGRTFEGKPCVKCGGTQRYFNGKKPCVACAKRRGAQQWRSLSPEAKRHRSRRYHLKRTFNMTLEQFESLLASQGGKCAICRKGESGRMHGWHIDHDHVTGVVRGILCGHCNNGLGHFKDSVSALIGAVHYLAAQRHENQ